MTKQKKLLIKVAFLIFEKKDLINRSLRKINLFFIIHKEKQGYLI